MDDHSAPLLIQSMDNSNNPPASNGASAKRRKKNDGSSEPSEPRRLRRSHEACARCRGKKIKCDSKHPKCTACVTAGVPCNQEDRHRQTLVARGYTERLEQIAAQSDALLKRHLPGFEFEQIDEICAREGIDINSLPPLQIPNNPSPKPQQQPPAPPAGYYPHPPPPGVAYYQYPPYLFHAPPFQISPPPPAHPAPALRGQDPKSNDMSSTQALAKSFGVAPSIVNDASSSSPIPLYQYPPPTIMYSNGSGGSSNPPALPTASARLAEEDLAVGSSGLDSGRDRVVQLEMPAPRDSAKWRVVSVSRSHNFTASSSMDIWIPNDRRTLLHIVDVYFTRLNPHRPVFFKHQFVQALNQLYDEGPSSRPVFDPGFICSLYLVLALGTLSELNRSGYQGEDPGPSGDIIMEPADKDSKEEPDSTSPRLRAKPSSSGKGRKSSKGSPAGVDSFSARLPPDWPAHDEFFDRALAVKPELRVTLSSLQALVLLHWYLYAERQGRTLWRLVGSIVRLAIELGLHHDPTTQMMPNPNPPAPSPTVTSDAEQQSSYEDIPTFTPLECTLRIRLWSIVLVHDRGTSILLGRPLAIAPSDANTPRPARARSGDPVFTTPPGFKAKPPTMSDLEFSEHFLLSAPIAEIQADIIISLYSPTRQSGETLLRNASRIIKSINLFRNSLPPSYKHYFTGTADWPMHLRHTLLSNLNESTGLTLLKLAISRILLLRALFSSKELGYADRRKALVDAIVQAHNVIAIHTVLVRNPEVGFFTSPVPLHIAAMVILYGRMSRCDEGIPGLSETEGAEEGSTNTVRILMEDVWSALDMLPRFRWRWETGSGNSEKGTNPLIAKLAEKVMEASFSETGLHGLGAPDTDPENHNGAAENGDASYSGSRLVTGIGRAGPVGQPVLIPEPEWEEEATSPNRERTERTRSPTASTGTWDSSWENAPSPKSQQTTPTLQAVYPPPSYPPTTSTGTAQYSYPHAPSSSGSNPVLHNGAPYTHTQYTYTPPVFGPQAATMNDKSAKATPVTPTTSVPVPTAPNRPNGIPASAMPLHMVEVPQSLFYPFYPDGVPVPREDATSPATTTNPSAPTPLLSSPPQPSRVARPTAAGGSSTAMAPVGPGSNGTASSLLAAVAVQAHAHGGQQGAPDMYMSEERVVQPPGHVVGSGFTVLGPSVYRGQPHPHYPPQPAHQMEQHAHAPNAHPPANGIPPPPQQQQQPSNHLTHGPPYNAHLAGHHVSMPPPPPPPHGVWATHGHTSPPRTTYAVPPQQ